MDQIRIRKTDEDQVQRKKNEVDTDDLPMLNQVDAGWILCNI
jgi:hypothetical protein